MTDIHGANAGKTARIIGGGSGIGAAVASLLAERGWQVAISGRDGSKLDAVAAGKPAIHPFPLDVTDLDACRATTLAVAEKLGSIELFLFGAARWEPMRVGEYDFAKFQTVYDTNVFGLVRLADPVIAQMVRQGGGEFAILASVAGYVGLPRAATYNSGKSALITLSETTRTELKPKNIRVRMIAPGFVKSPLTAKNDFDMPFLMETDEAARRIVDGLTKSDDFEIAFPKRMVALMKSLRALPYPLFFQVTDRMLKAITRPK